jgi:hypothetical protein
VLGVSAALAAGLIRLTAKASETVKQLLIGVIAALLIVATLLLNDDPWLVALFPTHNAIIYGNLALPACIFLAGFLLANDRIPTYRKWPVAVVIAGLGIYFAGAPIYNTPPPSHERWAGDVCLQTSFATCLPASAATLLRHHNIEGSEHELAQLSLTSRKGTSLLGIYRGLGLKVADEPFHVILERATFAEIQQTEHLPRILIVMLTPEVDALDPRYAQKWGWTVGQAHAVVLLGFEADGRPLIADPSVGVEHWSRDGLKHLYDGVTIRLEPDSPTPVRQLVDSSPASP